MTLRDRLAADLTEAAKQRDVPRLATLRLISAAIKDREIALRGEGQTEPVTDADVLVILARMVKQRLESIRAFELGARADLADKERAEISVIATYLPRQLTEAEVADAISAAVADTGAAGLRDLGRVMALLRERHAGQMDFGAAGPLIKARLA